MTAGYLAGGRALPVIAESTFAALRAVASQYFTQAAIATVYDAQSNDAPGATFYRWDSTSGSGDDGVNVIAPTDVGVGNGRWLAAELYSIFGRFTQDAAGTTSPPALQVRNATLAAAANPQWSPTILLSGSGWRTDTSLPWASDWSIQNRPLSFSSPQSILQFNHSVNGSVTSVLSITTGVAGPAMVLGGLPMAATDGAGGLIYGDTTTTLDVTISGTAAVTLTCDPAGVLSAAVVASTSEFLISHLTLAFNSTTTAPTITQNTRSGNGANAGQALLVRPQQGQAVASGTNNNGGDLDLDTGHVGTGGAGGAAGNLNLQVAGATQLQMQGGGVIVAPVTGCIIQAAGGGFQGKGTSFALLTASSGGIFLDASTGVHTLQVAAVTACTITAPVTGAASVIWATGATSVKYGQADIATASATGAATTLTGQNATGTTSIGGDLILEPGTGTSTNGSLQLNNLSTTTTTPGSGGAGALPAAPAGYVSIKINGSAHKVAFY